MTMHEDALKASTIHKSGGVRCKYCNEGIYIPSMGNLRDIIKRHEDKCPDNPNRKVPEHREYLEYKREIMEIDEQSAAREAAKGDD